MTNERIYVMVSRKCLFEAICQVKGYPTDPCPVAKNPDVYNTRFMPIDCVALRNFIETDKERRIRYAEKARVRNENAGSGRQA